MTTGLGPIHMQANTQAMYGALTCHVAMFNDSDAPMRISNQDVPHPLWSPHSLALFECDCTELVLYTNGSLLTLIND
jgi:hypothetical protein